jgi:hypothetical protein
MRICIVAEHASYRFGGEAILPAHYFARLRARGEEAWLVVHARTRDELEAAFPSDKNPSGLLKMPGFIGCSSELAELFLAASLNPLLVC